MSTVFLKAIRRCRFSSSSRRRSSCSSRISCSNLLTFVWSSIWTQQDLSVVDSKLRPSCHILTNSTGRPSNWYRHPANFFYTQAITSCFIPAIGSIVWKYDVTQKTGNKFSNISAETVKITLCLSKLWLNQMRDVFWRGRLSVAYIGKLPMQMNTDIKRIKMN